MQVQLWNYKFRDFFVQIIPEIIPVYLIEKIEDPEYDRFSFNLKVETKIRYRLRNVFVFFGLESWG